MKVRYENPPSPLPHKCLTLEPWQNEETCCQKHLLQTHVTPMFPSFATRGYVSAVKKKKHILLLETMFPVWQNWKTFGKHVSAASVSCNMFSFFAMALNIKPRVFHCLLVFCYTLCISIIFPLQVTARKQALFNEMCRNQLQSQDALQARQEKELR